MRQTDEASAGATAGGSWRRLWLLLAWVLLPWAPGAGAQSLESALAPGPVIQGHARLESDCKSCHVRFDRAAQDRLCTECHKDVGQDLRAKTGFHGRRPPQACRSCHTDHRGREMRIAEFDRKAFDHQQTDLALRGKHLGLDCGLCHKPGQKYRQAASDCLACHRKDDTHQGSLGARCADCHDERSWRGATFDHATTRFALTGKHVEAKCSACHKTADLEKAPTTCIGCHRKDDKHKAQFGDKCETCHGTRDWAGSTFRHDTDTRYPLRGRHREIKCESCHGGTLHRDKPGSVCLDCHRKDDKHAGTLGTNCAACHAERSWREPVKFDHDRSSFPLRGGHAKAACRDCHGGPRFKETPSDCLACHRKDDKHTGTLGSACGDCHTDRDWRASRFSHERTRFLLRDGHAVPPRQCHDCHRDARGFRSTALDCDACHRKDDRHEGQLGSRCESCHGAQGWKLTRFDHARARFALTGSHVRTACASCHRSARHHDAPRDCLGCHRKDDRHQARFGERCENCHNARDWRLWTFDHDKRTRHALEAGHAKVACEACHRQPAPAGQAAAPVEPACVACHRRDDAHDGAFGLRCENCHAPTRWKQTGHRMRSPALPGPGATTPQRPGGST